MTGSFTVDVHAPEMGKYVIERPIAVEPVNREGSAALLCFALPFEDYSMRIFQEALADDAVVDLIVIGRKKIRVRVAAVLPLGDGTIVAVKPA